jgi:hypothetical protein
LLRAAVDARSNAPLTAVKADILNTLRPPMTILIAVISYLLATGRWAIGLSAAISMRDRPHPRALKKKLLAETAISFLRSQHSPLGDLR